MKLKLDFVTKVPKVAKDNQVILLNNKTTQNIIVKSLNKSIFSNKLFLERKFLIQNINDKIYIFVNCTKSKTSLDYEKLGSNLFLFLKNNKIENSFFETNLSKITNIQLEKFLHGAQLKSYEFNVYKTDKSKNLTINFFSKNSLFANNDLLKDFIILFLLALSFTKIISLSLASFGTLLEKSNFSFIFLKYLIDNVVYLINY